MPFENTPILVFYGNRGTARLRSTLKEHLFYLDAGPVAPIVYVNAAFPIPWRLIETIPFRAVLFHTTFLALRWSPSFFQKRCAIIARRVKDWSCPKLALPQDEFVYTEALSRFLDEVGITHVYSCAPLSEWPKIYPYQQNKKVHFDQILTGYLSKQVVQQVTELEKPERTIDVGYRARKVDYWLGRHGRYKVEVAAKVQEAAKKLSLTTDISLDEEEVLTGLDWFRFLLKCKATVGVEGGASILDSYGSLRDQTGQYLARKPDASFEEVWEKLLKPHEGFRLFALSPRHLEAALTRTVQILIEGSYNGILKPWAHYIPLRSDYRNLEECLAKLNDAAFCHEMTARAYEDIVLSKRYSYELFAEKTLQDLNLTGPRHALSWKSLFACKALRAWDKLLYLFLLTIDLRIGKKRVAYMLYQRWRGVR